MCECRWWVPLSVVPVLLGALVARGAALDVNGAVDDLRGKLRAELATVLDEAAADELVPITIVMRDQVPREEIRRAGALPRKQDRREAVTSLLKSMANRTQPELLEQLRQGQLAGNVGTSIQSLWIRNVVGTSVNREAAYEIAARDDVAYLNWNRPLGDIVFPVEPPEEPAAAASIECGVDLMGAPQVWADFGITGTGVVVAVIDTGCCITHPDLANQIWTNPGEIPGNGIDDDNNGFIDDIHGWSFDFNGSSPDISDTNGHGTHVSGTVGGDGTDGIQTGMAPDVQIMTTKFWNSFSGELSVWNSMQYATDNGADVTTASLGWPHSFNPDRVTWRMVCENTIAAGLVVLFAAGNEGCSNPPDNVRTPGDVPSVLTIGATDCNDVIAGFSSCGPITWQGIPPYDDCPFPPGCLKPTVSAPGVSTVSCDNSPCTGYATKSGTSMATPHVAGAVALMLEANPNLSHDEVVQILEDTAVDLGAPGPDNSYGAGRVDAYAAVQAAMVPTGACCRADTFTCEEVPEAECDGPCDLYRGDGTDCGGPLLCFFEVPRPCCLPDGTCESMSRCLCNAAGGTSVGGPFDSCATVECPGACCRAEDFSCEVVPESQCDGPCDIFRGEGTDCVGPACVFEVPRPCCLPDGTCESLSSCLCAAKGGTIAGGPFDSCATVECGACCRAEDFACEVVSRSQCDGPCDKFAGEGTDCDGPLRCAFEIPRPCCLPDGSCRSLSRCLCEAAGGVSKGTPFDSCADVDCPTGACCKAENFACVVTAPHGCDGPCDLYRGDGTDCGGPFLCAFEVPRPCCLPDGTCIQTSRCLCEAQGGRPKGSPFDTCQDVTCP